jgi:hypothetical protein
VLLEFVGPDGKPANYTSEAWEASVLCAARCF